MNKNEINPFDAETTFLKGTRMLYLYISICNVSLCLESIKFISSYPHFICTYKKNLLISNGCLTKMADFFL